MKYYHNIKYILLVILYTLCFVSCNHRGHNKTYNDQLLNVIEATQLQYPNDAEQIAKWGEWLRVNHDIYISEGVSQEYAWVINSLLTMHHCNGMAMPQSIQMTQWILSLYNPVAESADKLQQYKNLEQQVLPLLNIDTINTTIKLDLTLFMSEFMVRLYEDKLRGSINESEILVLLENDISTWRRYYDTTVDMYDRLVLEGKNRTPSSYYYKIDIMLQRYQCLVRLYLMEYVDWSIYESDDYFPKNVIRWDEVGYEYEQITNKIANEEQLAILEAEKEAFGDYLNSSWELMIKLDAVDYNSLQHQQKAQSLAMLFDYRPTVFIFPTLI